MRGRDRRAQRQAVREGGRLIRLAREGDLEALTPLGEEFFGLFPGVAAGDFDPEHWCAAWRGFLGSGAGFIVVNEALTAALGVVVYPDTFSGELAGSGMFWISRRLASGPEALTMLRAAEAECRARGAAKLDMASLGDRPSPAILYRRRGYELSHQSFTKELR